MWSGTKMGSSITISFDPVAFSPITSHVSSMRYWVRGIRKVRYPSPATIPPNSAQVQYSEPELQPQRPDTMQPPSTFSTFAPTGLYELLTRVLGSSPYTVF